MRPLAASQSGVARAGGTREIAFDLGIRGKSITQCPTPAARLGRKKQDADARKLAGLGRDPRVGQASGAAR